MGYSLGVNDLICVNVYILYLFIFFLIKEYDWLTDWYVGLFKCARNLYIYKIKTLFLTIISFSFHSKSISFYFWHYYTHVHRHINNFFCFFKIKFWMLNDDALGLKRKKWNQCRKMNEITKQITILLIQI